MNEKKKWPRKNVTIRIFHWYRDFSQPCDALKREKWITKAIKADVKESDNCAMTRIIGQQDDINRHTPGRRRYRTRLSSLVFITLRVTSLPATALNDKIMKWNKKQESKDKSRKNQWMCHDEDDAKTTTEANRKENKGRWKKVVMLKVMVSINYIRCVVWSRHCRSVGRRLTIATLYSLFISSFLFCSSFSW